MHAMNGGGGSVELRRSLGIWGLGVAIGSFSVKFGIWGLGFDSSLEVWDLGLGRRSFRTLHERSLGFGDWIPPLGCARELRLLFGRHGRIVIDAARRVVGPAARMLAEGANEGA